MNKKAIAYLLVAIVVVLGGIATLFYSGPLASGAYDEFTECLTDKGAVMYGTKTCPYCTKQKQVLGDLFRFIKYVECTVETQKCIADGVQGAPLWTFQDGERLESLQQLAALALKQVVFCPRTLSRGAAWVANWQRSCV